MTHPASLDGEDQKLVALARAARARIAAPEGAAVRDLDGRSYTGATVALDSLRLSALQAAVVAAVAAGATGVAVAAVVTAAHMVDPPSAAAIRELGAEAPIFLVAPQPGGPVRLAPA